MPLLRAADGTTYQYQTIQQSGASIVLDGITFLAGTLADYAVVDQAYLTRMTVLAYRSRFTGAEKVAIEMAALDDPSAALELRQKAAEVRVYLQDLAAAKFIDPTDDATRGGALYLEAAGLLAEGRALEILDAPIQAKERI